jgi:hypothetical protein
MLASFAQQRRLLQGVRMAASSQQTAQFAMRQRKSRDVSGEAAGASKPA